MIMALFASYSPVRRVLRRMDSKSELYFSNSLSSSGSILSSFSSNAISHITYMSSHEAQSFS
ncbi:hypothetical protein EVA_12591 [gut metagenome]|uniref:Uncharacterized protein n=1 Tax=gut metagenome TaxID=749906 RepID=J9GIG1_9ZZZZ